MSSLPPLFDGMGQAMKAMAEHQRVIAENIANSETAGYKARTVEAPDFSALVESYTHVTGAPQIAKPRVTLSGSMTSLGATSVSGGTVVLDGNTSETKPDGNNVTLEDQLLTLGQVQQDYAAMTNLYRKQMALMKTAVGKG